MSTADTVKWLLIDRAYSYIILASATCVLYDHITTLHDEIEYVWKRPKLSIVQILFFVSRYGGDALQIYPAYIIVRHIIDGTVKIIFIHGTYLAYNNRSNLIQVYIGYLGTIILSATQGITLYRLSCMYGHKRKIIAILAIGFTTELTSMIISQSIANNIHQAVPDPAPSVHICKQDSFPSWAYSIWIPIVFQEIIMLALSVGMGISYYKADSRKVLQNSLQGTSSPPSLLFIMIRDSITFPIIGLIVSIVNLVSWATLPYLVAQMTFPFALFIPCMLGSHLVINLREAYYQPFTEECEIKFVQDGDNPSTDIQFP